MVVQDMIWSLHGRGKFPGHHVLWFLSKMHKNGCRRVIMDAFECNGGYAHGGEQEQDKKSPKWAVGTCFWMYDQGKKMPHVVQDDCGVQGGPRGEIKGK